MLAKVVNDDAGILDERGALRFFASKLAPTKKEASREAATGRLECGEATAKSKAKAGTVRNVGAGLLAKVVNDDAGILNERGALRFFASKLAPTKKEAGREAATGRLECGEAKAKSKAKAGTVQNVGAGLLAKVVNDDAGILNERGALRFFASKLAPTKKEASREAATGRLKCGEATAKSKAKAGTVRNVGAGLLAKVVNDDAGILDERGALRFFASKLAPTEKEAGR